MATKHNGMYRERGTYNGVKYDIHAKNKKELREKLLRKFAEIDSGVIDSNTTVKVWFEKWFKTYELPRTSPTTARNRRTQAKKMLSEIGNMRLQDVRAAHLQSILNSLDCSQSYGNKICQLIQRVFRDARRNKLIRDDPAEDLELPQLKKEAPRRAITAKERELLIDAAKHHRGGLWVMLQLYCGLRPSEAAAVQKVDLSGDVLHVYKAVNRYEKTIGDTKTDSGVRDVPIPQALRDFIADWQTYWDALQPFDYVVSTLSGNLLSAGGQQSVWKSLRRMMEISNGAELYRNAIVAPTLAGDFVPYCLRHTYCTDLQAAGVPINVAKELMGHSDISLTSRIYTHSSNEALLDAGSKINALNAKRKVGTDLETGSKTGT